MKAGVAVAPPGLYCPTYFIATKLSPLRGYRVTSVTHPTAAVLPLCGYPHKVTT